MVIISVQCGSCKILIQRGFKTLLSTPLDNIRIADEMRVRLNKQQLLLWGHDKLPQLAK